MTSKKDLCYNEVLEGMILSSNPKGNIMQAIYRAILVTTTSDNAQHAEIVDAPMCELQEILKEFEIDDPGADRCLNSVSITFLRAELTAR